MDQQQDPPQAASAQQQVDQNAQVIQFVDELISQKFAGQEEEITPEVKNELRMDLLKQLDEFIMAKVISELSDEDLTTFENMIKEGKNQEELQKFATERIPDFTGFATDAFITFRSIYLGSNEEE